MKSKKLFISFVILLISVLFTFPQSAIAGTNQMKIIVSGPDSDGITNVGLCFTNPSEMGSSVNYSGTTSSGGASIHSGTPSCPSFAFGSSGFRLTPGTSYTYAFTATDRNGNNYSDSITFTAVGISAEAQAALDLKNANDAAFRTAIDAATAAAQVESKAYNAANPGKQKCIQWGPIVNANGGTSSGGVCANVVEPGAGTTVATQEAPSVQAPVTTSPSSSISSGSTSTSSSASNSSSSNSTSSSSANPTTATPVEDFSKWGSGTPYTRVLKGQLSTKDCPSGFQSANGVIGAIGVGTFTECWPENAWAAYRLGGSIWEQFKSSGGTYDAKAEIDRQNKVAELKALAKSVAQTAADQTPGIQRCSRWTGYGESGQECAYTFVKPGPSTSSPSSTPSSASETKTATTSSAPETKTATTSSGSSGTSTATSPSSTSSSTVSTQTNSNDPFPSLKNGDEIPSTRITSAPGLKQSEWEQTATYKALACPAASGKSGGVDLNFTISQSDDRWFAYCVKSFQQSSQSSAVSSPSGETSTATSTIIQPSETPTATTSSSSGSASSSDSATATTSNSQSSSTSTSRSGSGASSSNNTNEAPTLESTAIKVNGTLAELKKLAVSVVQNSTEKIKLQDLLNRVDKVVRTTSSKTIKLPSSIFLEESAESRTPEFCSITGVTVLSLKKGNCLIDYTITDSDGNMFTTLIEIFFKK